MKNAKNVMYLAVLGATVCSSSAWAGYWTNQDRGPFVTDGGTRVRVTSQAGSTWEHWYWQGKNDGLQFRCPPNNPGGNCTQAFAINRSTATSTSNGLTIGVTGSLGNNAFARGDLAATYQRVWTRTVTTGWISTSTANVARGQYVQPVSIQTRRWMRGDFNGAHIKTQTTGTKGRSYYYDWRWQTVGSWTDNRAIGRPYTTFKYSSRPF
jgi:hypothetical protein